MSYQPESQIVEPEPGGLAEIILPCQFFSAMGGKGLCAEQRLMLAVLLDAINIVQSWNGIGSGSKRKAFADALQWITTRDYSHAFSFDNVCEALEIEPDIFRGRLTEQVMTRGIQASPGRTRHLRIHQSCRAQHMVANRERRRKPPRLAS